MLHVYFILKIITYKQNFINKFKNKYLIKKLNTNQMFFFVIKQFFNNFQIVYIKKNSKPNSKV